MVEIAIAAGVVGVSACAAFVHVSRLWILSRADTERARLQAASRSESETVKRQLEEMRGQVNDLSASIALRGRS